MILGFNNDLSQRIVSFNAFIRNARIISHSEADLFHFVLRIHGVEPAIVYFHYNIYNPQEFRCGVSKVQSPGLNPVAFPLRERDFMKKAFSQAPFLQAAGLDSLASPPGQANSVSLPFQGASRRSRTLRACFARKYTGKSIRCEQLARIFRLLA
jgi:hypothetical protein